MLLGYSKGIVAGCSSLLGSIAPLSGGYWGSLCNEQSVSGKRFEVEQSGFHNITKSAITFHCARVAGYVCYRAVEPERFCRKRKRNRYLVARRSRRYGNGRSELGFTPDGFGNCRNYNSNPRQSGNRNLPSQCYRDQSTIVSLCDSFSNREWSERLLARCE